MPATHDDLVRSRRLAIHRQLATTNRWRWRKGRSAAAAPDAPKPDQPRRRWSSRQLHHLGAVGSHAWAGVIVLFIALGWIVYGSATGFPGYWSTILESVTSVVTVVMLFAIQHLQARDQTVIQRKLDELLRAAPHANNQLIAVEEAPDEELEALTELNRQDRTG